MFGGSGSVRVMESSRTVDRPGWNAASEEGERLLAALEESGPPLVRLRYGSGDRIYGGDEAGRALYVLTGGVAKLFVSYRAHAGSRNATCLLLGSGEVFGYPLFAGRRAGRIPAEAFTDCEVVKIPGAFLERVVRRRPEVALEVAALLERRLVEYEELVECLLPRRTDARLAGMVQILARRFGERTGNGSVAIGLTLTRIDLAQMIASTRESVTAAVVRLRRKGILAMEAGRVIIPDPERLAEIGRR